MFELRPPVQFSTSFQTAKVFRSLNSSSRFTEKLGHPIILWAKLFLVSLHCSLTKLFLVSLFFRGLFQNLHDGLEFRSTNEIQVLDWGHLQFESGPEKKTLVTNWVLCRKCCILLFYKVIFSERGIISLVNMLNVLVSIPGKE